MTEPARRRSGLRLARLSFDDGERASDLLSAPALGLWDVERAEPVDDGSALIVSALGRSADPDAAAQALADLVAAAGPGLISSLASSSAMRSRLLPLLAVSSTLAEHLIAYPDQWHVLDGDADFDAMASRLAAATDAEALRVAYRRELVAIAGRDLAGELDLRHVCEALADLADATLEAALGQAVARLSPDAPRCRLAIIAMGKTGARELNYVSDVDVVFVAEPDGHDDTEAALRTATTLAVETIRIGRHVAWEVDAGLRPEGKDGPLVRTLASHEAYYRRWASTWEFQALLKARPAAGDAELGQRYRETINPFVWSAAERPDFVADVRAMRQRVIEHIPRDVADRELKLGRGGLRDVEFAVQLLQLVHGRGDETLRVPGTLEALEALRDGGYVGVDDAVSLSDAYVFLRTTEHRLQLQKLRRTHVIPDDQARLTWLALAMGYRPDRRGGAREVWQAEWALHSREVRRLNEKLFYRPLLEAVARVPAEGLRLTPAEAGRRLAALGFADPARALQHIESLTSGLSRRAVLQRALLPVLLSDFADAPDPDAGLLAYRQVSDQLGATPWYLRLLRDEGLVAPRLAYLLGTSRYVGRMLGRAPEILRMLASDDELRPRSQSEIAATMRESATRADNPTAAVAAVRGVRRTELLRTAFADLLEMTDVTAVCDAISATTEATLDVALQVALQAVADERQLPELPLRFTIIAMGRLGGGELSYGSDADVMFVYEPVSSSDLDVTRLAQDVAGKLRALLTAPSSIDPPLGVDADLRPEGRNGPLVRSLGAYQQYYARWSAPWEAQALLRARYAVGDADLGARFIEVIDPVRYPAGGLSQADLVEIRRIKGRVDAERLPRGADPTTHTKLGRGGLADIEWTVQLLQLQHAAAVPSLQTTRTLAALDAARTAGLLTDEQAGALADAWSLATRLRNAIMLVRDKAEDQIPAQATHAIALAGVGRALGYEAGFDPGQVIDDYRRAARRARRVVEDVFYSPLP